MKQNGYDTGQTRFFQQLRDEGFLMRNGRGDNIPTQRAMEMGLFEIQERRAFIRPGVDVIDQTARITVKGQFYFMRRYTGRMNFITEDGMRRIPIFGGGHALADGLRELSSNPA